MYSLLVLFSWVWYSSCILYSEFSSVFWFVYSEFWVPLLSVSSVCGVRYSLLYWYSLLGYSSLFCILSSGFSMWYSEF